VLVPEGFKDKYPPGTYDGTIGIRPSQLQLQTWLDVLRLAPNEPQGIVLSVFLKRMKEANPNFTLTQLTQLIDAVITIDETPAEERNETAINVTQEITFRAPTIEALQSKILATSTWGIFSKNALNIFELVKPGIVTVIDLSHHEIPESVGALLVGFLTERLYALRKMESLQSMHKDIGQEVAYVTAGQELPPPVLIVEEAHNYLGKGKGQKFSVASFKKYIKQGRQAKCSLITITQQPQELDTSPLSQIDGIIVFKTTHDKDLKTIQDIAPYSLPKNWKDIVRNLEIGEAYIIYSNKPPEKIKIRPRRSIHLARSESTSLSDLEDLTEQKRTTSEGVESLEPEEIPERITDQETQVDLDEVTEIESIPPPPPTNNYQELNEVSQLSRELYTAKLKNRNLREGKNDEIGRLNAQVQQLELENAKLKETTTELQRSQRPQEINGILLAVFDQVRGHISDYYTPSPEVTDVLIREIARSAIGFGEQLDQMQFTLNKIPKIHCTSKRFEQPMEDARGGTILYALVIFTSDETLQFDDKFLGAIIKNLQNDWDTRQKIIDKYYSQIFFPTHQLRQALVLYQKELEALRKKFKVTKDRKEKIIQTLKEQIVDLRLEQRELHLQIAGLTDYLKIDDPNVRDTILNEQRKHLLDLTKELQETKGQLQDEQKTHQVNLDDAKEEILKMDRQIEQLEIKLETVEEYGVAPINTEIPSAMLRIPQSQVVSSSRTQTQAQEITDADLLPVFQNQRFRAILQEFMQKEREPVLKEMEDLKATVLTYRNGIGEARQIILDLKQKRDTQVIKAEVETSRIYKYSKQLEMEIYTLKRVNRDLMSPITVNTPEEKKRFQEKLPTEVFVEFNKEFLPEQIAISTQQLKKTLTSLDTLSFRIMSILESINTTLNAENLGNLIMDYAWKTIRGRINDLEKKKLVNTTKKGSRILFSSNLKRLIMSQLKPFSAAMTEVQMNEIYTQIRNVLEIRLLPLPTATKNGGIRGFSNNTGVS
jgi:hypothetical protein